MSIEETFAVRLSVCTEHELAIKREMHSIRNRFFIFVKLESRQEQYPIFVKTQLY